MIDVLGAHSEAWSGSTANIRVFINKLICALVLDQDPGHLFSVHVLLYRTIVRVDLLLMNIVHMGRGHLLLHKCIG